MFQIPGDKFDEKKLKKVHFFLTHFRDESVI